MKPGGIITRVLCLDFYQPLFDMLDELERDAKKWVPVFREKSRENKSGESMMRFFLIASCSRLHPGRRGKAAPGFSL